ncbi:hypothetical protein [Thermobifida alba]|nr:hypothetical protein [Thermobifida alba]
MDEDRNELGRPHACWVRGAGENPRIDEEIHRRITDLADPSRPRHWHPY